VLLLLADCLHIKIRNKGKSMIKIVADTTSCLSLKKAQELGIPYLPQFIIFGNQQYRDDTELNSDKFLEKLKSSPTLPKTAAPQPSLYIPIYQELLQQGHSIIVLCPSTELSGTFRGASVAAQDFPDANIQIIDTRSIGSGFGEIILFAHQMAEDGKTETEIIDAVKEMASREKLIFLVDTLEYLYKGGRIGGAKALFGSVLQVKPILELKNGRAEVIESQRTKHKAMARFKQLIHGQCPQGNISHLSIMHGGNLDEANALADEFKKDFNVTEIPIYYFPPAILVHAGPGVIAVSFFIQK
jgi:DegV family protein with EDD domain